MKTTDELLSAITNNVGAIQTHLKSVGQPQLSFDVKAPPVVLLPEELEDSRSDAIEALEALAALLRSPIPYLLDMTGPKTYISASLHTIGRFRIAEQLRAGEEVEYSELATRCGLEADSLQRLLRVAVANRIFEEPRPGLVRHNAVSLSIASQPLFSTWLRVAFEEMYPAQLKTAEALEKWPATEDPKQTAYALANVGEDASFFDILGKHPERAQRFAEATTMIQASPALDLRFVVDNFQWGSGAQTIVDVGGSHGSVCAALLRSNPEAIGIVQDLPEVVAGGEVPGDLKGRMSFKAQNFFHQQKTTGADIYFFRSIFHDWPDSSVIAILKNQVPALKAGARLVICEVCLPEPGKARMIDEQLLRGYDWAMKLTFNGKERDEPSWRDKLARADSRFRLDKIRSPKRPMLSIIEVLWKGS